jgi:hypothetical protein
LVIWSRTTTILHGPYCWSRLDVAGEREVDEYRVAVVIITLWKVVVGLTLTDRAVNSANDVFEHLPRSCIQDGAAHLLPWAVTIL